jgi:hypothetical protein
MSDRLKAFTVDELHALVFQLDVAETVVLVMSSAKPHSGCPMTSNHLRDPVSLARQVVPLRVKFAVRFPSKGEQPFVRSRGEFFL